MKSFNQLQNLLMIIKEANRDCISKKTIKEFLDRLALAETWILKNLLGDDHKVQAAAVNVEVSERKADADSNTFFGDLYVIQNLKNRSVSFKLYDPKENKFSWAVDNIYNMNGYVDLKCNTHILHLGDSVYIFKFPNKKERMLFRDNLNRVAGMEENGQNVILYQEEKGRTKYIIIHKVL